MPRQTIAVTPRLPTPTGPHRLGVTTLHMVDHARTDPWNGSARELMGTVFYPAETTTGYPVAPQMPPAAASVFGTLDTVYMHPELPYAGVNWAGTRTHSHTDAPAQPVRRPVLLYSPGGVDPRTLGTGVAEDLASHGYVVVTIDHPGETSEVEFPGGRVRTIDIPGDPRTDPALFRTMIDTRVADTRFVLDELASAARMAGVPANLGRALDLRRVGAFGHSAGGATASEAMYEDERINAAVNMEGYLDYQDGELLPIARHGTDRPLLLLGTDGFRDERFERTWSAMLAHGRTDHDQLNNATHWVFTDYGAMAPQLQEAGLMTAEDRASLVGAISPEESVPAIRQHLLGFFGRNL